GHQCGVRFRSQPEEGDAAINGSPSNSGSANERQRCCSVRTIVTAEDGRGCPILRPPPLPSSFEAVQIPGTVAPVPVGERRQPSANSAQVSNVLWHRDQDVNSIGKPCVAQCGGYRVANERS